MYGGAYPVTFVGGTGKVLLVSQCSSVDSRRQEPVVGATETPGNAEKEGVRGGEAVVDSRRQQQVVSSVETESHTALSLFGPRR